MTYTKSEAVVRAIYSDGNLSQQGYINAFQTAVEFGITDFLKFILWNNKYNPSVNYTIPSRTQLTEITMAKNLLAAQIILQYGTLSEEERDATLVMASGVSIEKPCSELVRIILEYVNTSQRAHDRALQIAVQMGHADIVAVLLDKGRPFRVSLFLNLQEAVRSNRPGVVRELLKRSNYPLEKLRDLLSGTPNAAQQEIVSFLRSKSICHNHSYLLLSTLVAIVSVLGAYLVSVNKL